MKKLILLLFIPLVGFGQIIEDKKLGKFDIRTLEDKYITIEVGSDVFPYGHRFNSSSYKNVFLKSGKNKRKWNVYDAGVKIRLQDQADILNFFAKYNYDIVNSNSQSDGGVIVNNVVVSSTSISLTFVNNN